MAISSKSITFNIAEDAIETGEIKDGTIAAEDLEDRLLAAGNIDGLGALAQKNTIDNTNLIAKIITAGDIVDNTITSLNIAEDAIETGEIKDGTIAAEDLEDGLLAAGNIDGLGALAQKNTIDNTNLIAKIITAGDIVDNTITSLNIAEDAIETGEIKDGTIAAEDLEDGLLAAGNIDGLSLKSLLLAISSMITSLKKIETEIKDGTIAAEDLEDGLLAAGNIDGLSLKSLLLAISSITRSPLSILLKMLLKLVKLKMVLSLLRI